MCPSHDDRPEKRSVLPRATDALGADIKNSDEVLAADQVRRTDDRRTEQLQEEAAEDQEVAERLLHANADRLRDSSEEIRDVREHALRNRARVEQLSEGVRSLHGETVGLVGQVSDPEERR